MSVRLVEGQQCLQGGYDQLFPRFRELDNRDLLNEVINLGLPNLVETVGASMELAKDECTPQRPFFVRPPVPGRYTDRPGERLTHRELMTAVDEWLDETDGQTRFVIQGGNRYVTVYAYGAYDQKIPDIKIMSVEKAPLSAQLLTILTPKERQSPIDPEQLDKLTALLPPELPKEDAELTRAELLPLIANFNLCGPFKPNTSDELLQEELTEAVANIEEGITIPNNGAISMIMEGTAVAGALSRDGLIYFLDDLFYRGRTLYSLAILMTACGGNPTNMRLTTISSDIKSVGLESPYHKVLRGGKLYPFENSIRTEQGYWQDVGSHYIFTDMGAYWEHLNSRVDHKQSKAEYDQWQLTLEQWADEHLSDSLSERDMSLISPLLWLSVYHSNFGLKLDVDRIVDQKGYRIGACVPFARLVDRFISQEEPVEARRQFKNQVRNTLTAIEDAAISDPESYNSLVGMYRNNQQALDYQGLGFITEPDVQESVQEDDEGTSDILVAEVADNIATQALNFERPLVVGINGVDGSGKTTLSSELHERLENHGINVTVIHVDDFTQPYSRRTSSNDLIERYYNNTFDFDSLKRDILEPLVAGRLGQISLKHENPYDASQAVEHSYLFVSSPSVVLVEGVFIFRPELAKLFDTKIFVDLPISEMFARAIERDVPRFGFDVLKKYKKRYIPAQERYLREVQPMNTSDVVISNIDRHNPYIVNRGPSSV